MKGRGGAEEEVELKRDDLLLLIKRELNNDIPSCAYQIRRKMKNRISDQIVTTTSNLCT